MRDFRTLFFYCFVVENFYPAQQLYFLFLSPRVLSYVSPWSRSSVFIFSRGSTVSTTRTRPLYKQQAQCLLHKSLLRRLPLQRSRDEMDRNSLLCRCPSSFHLQLYPEPIQSHRAHHLRSPHPRLHIVLPHPDRQRFLPVRW